MVEQIHGTGVCACVCVCVCVHAWAPVYQASVLAEDLHTSQGANVCALRAKRLSNCHLERAFNGMH